MKTFEQIAEDFLLELSKQTDEQIIADLKELGYEFKIEFTSIPLNSFENKLNNFDSLSKENLPLAS